ncbi:MAG TPA: hypothetical protein VF057_13020 [Thermoanaerobaculia bacterium]
MAATTSSRVTRVAMAALLAALAAVVALRFLHPRVSGPLQRDEVEFLHTAWLLATGRELFTDFFQNHSPVYLRLLGAAADDGVSLRWIYALRGANALLALGSAFVAGFLCDRDRRGLPAIAGFASFLLFVTPLATFQIRPEGLATLAFVSGWALLDRQRRIAAALAMGISVAMTPRALIPVATLIVAEAILRGREHLRRETGWAALAAITTVALLLVSADPRQTWKWMLVFSRAGGPPSSLMATVPATTLLPYWTATAIAAAALITRKRELAAPAAVLFASWLAMALEPRRFSQSLTFVAIASAVLLGRLIAPALKHGGTFPGRAVTAILGIVVSGLLIAGIRTHHPVTGTTERLALHLDATRETLSRSIAIREAICTRLAGQTVFVEPTEFHPICLADAHYYWRGAEYILDGTLDRAGIVDPRWNPAGAIATRRPAIIRTIPSLRDTIAAASADAHVARGDFWLRRDVVTGGGR